MNKQGITVHRTHPYGEEFIGQVRIYHRDEVRIIGSKFRVVQVTARGRQFEEEMLYEYITPTEYDSLIPAVLAAQQQRNDYLRNRAVETKKAS